MTLCDYTWNSNCGKPGSQHYCALEPGHLPPHECRGADGTCNAISDDADEPEHEAELPFHLRRGDVSGDLELDITIEEMISR